MDTDELSAAKEHFECTNSRMVIQSGDLVIGRYSVLPFYKEQERDIKLVGAQLINTLSQHNYVADMQNWVYDLKDLTPKTWDRLENLPEDCAFVLKGETNSRKHDWLDLMFAPDKKAAIAIHSKLTQDGLIGYQKIYIRQYIPLKTYMVGIKGLPITHEFRFFVCDKQILCGGYYWSSHAEELEIKPDVNSVPQKFLQEVVNLIGTQIRFYVVDVAQTIDGEWIVIELNDGQMSGLSENDPKELYGNLRKILGE